MNSQFNDYFFIIMLSIIVLNEILAPVTKKHIAFHISQLCNAFTLSINNVK